MFAIRVWLLTLVGIRPGLLRRRKLGWGCRVCILSCNPRAPLHNEPKVTETKSSQVKGTHTTSPILSIRGESQG